MTDPSMRDSLDMLTPKVTEISRAGHTWLPAAKVQGVLVERRPRPQLVLN